MKKVLAYGVSVHCDLDLSDYLQVGEARRSLNIVKQASTIKLTDYSETVSLSSSHGRQLAIKTERPVARSVAGQPWCFEVADIVRFYWVGGAGEITYQCLGLHTDQLLAFWMIHIFLPLYFSLEGRYEFIHACSVEVEGNTVLFIAPSQGGKSTLTDHFLKQGHRLVSDDKVATYLADGTYYAVPSHPNHRPYRKFEDLGYRVSLFNPAHGEIATIYSLQSRDPGSPVIIKEITGHQKFASIRPSYLFDFAFLKEQRMKYLAQLLSTVPVFTVDVPWDLERLAEVYDAIRLHRINCQETSHDGRGLA